MISIIIPVYNVEKYLERCLDSILKQTYGNFEIILVDDGSTDDSPKICEKYQDKDKRIKFFFNTEKGPGPARNLGIEKSSGEYIYFMDSDDEAISSLLEENYNLAIEHNADIVCFSYFKVLYKNKRPVKDNIYQIKTNKLLLGNEIANTFWDLQEKELINILWNKLYKRELIVKNKLRFTDLRKGQDAVFNFQLLKYVNRMYLNEKPYYRYHLYDSNSITSRYTPNLFNIFKDFDSYLVDLIKDWGIFNERSRRKINELRFLNINTCMANLVKPENNHLDGKEKLNVCKMILNDSFTKETISSVNTKELRSLYRKVCFNVLKTQNSFLNLLFQKALRLIK